MVAIPIYRGKKIDSSEDAEGGLSPCEKFIITDNIEIVTKGVYNSAHEMNFDEEIVIADIFIEIDPSTLTISFDNGETFKSIKETEELLGYGTLQRALSTGIVDLG